MAKRRTIFLSIWLAGWLALASLMLTPPPAQLVPDVSDKLLHFAAYLAMTSFGLSFCRTQAAIAATAAITILLGSTLEYLQRLVPGRSFDPADLAANGAGTLAGYLLAASLLLVAARAMQRPPS